MENSKKRLARPVQDTMETHWIREKGQWWGETYCFCSVERKNAESKPQLTRGKDC